MLYLYISDLYNHQQCISPLTVLCECDLQQDILREVQQQLVKLVTAGRQEDGRHDPREHSLVVVLE